MKNLLRTTLLFLVGAASISLAATPPIDVTVSDNSGNVAFKGKTKGDGTFATGKLQPGNYVVQFNANNLKGIYAIVSSAGKTKVTADAVAGEKFAKGGVAMRIEVGSGLGISGQVAEASGKEYVMGGTKVKIMNGRRYFWATSSTGSHLGGRWVEEGSPEANNILQISRQNIQNIQDKGVGLGP